MKFLTNIKKRKTLLFLSIELKLKTTLIFYLKKSTGNSVKQLFYMIGQNVDYKLMKNPSNCAGQRHHNARIRLLKSCL